MSFNRRQKVRFKDYFDYQDFRSWIESQPDERIISRGRKDNNPICYYLREIVGLKDITFIQKGFPRRIKFELPSGRRCITVLRGETKELNLINFKLYRELNAKEVRRLIFEASKRYKKLGKKCGGYTKNEK